MARLVIIGRAPISPQRKNATLTSSIYVCLKINLALFSLQVMLLQLDNVDPVESEVRYHLTCYNNYSRFMQEPKKLKKPIDRKYSRAFNKFCEEFVTPRIVEKKQLFRLSVLKKVFQKYILDIEKVDASGYRAAKLKHRLKKQYPELIFLESRNKSTSKMVFIGSLPLSDFVEDKLHSHESERMTETETETEPETETEAEELCEKQQAPLYEHSMNELFASAMYLRSVLTNHSPTFQCWPPTSEDFLEKDVVKKCIPDLLIRFVAWLVGVSSDPFVEEIEATVICKIYSICQDIIYLSSGGKTRTPKHMSLAMSVRHITGSASLIDILNGLGHCVSNSILLEHDTALATLQELKGPVSVPSCIKPNNIATIVWDNNDFGEETATGKGTTHNTNGIIIQRIVSEQDDHSKPKSTVRLPRDKKRSFVGQASNLAVFRGHTKVPPQKIHGSVLEDDNTMSIQEISRKSDLAYVLTRIPGNNKNEPPLPTWTGFNTKLAIKVPQLSAIGYLPVIDASPTEMDTVLTILQRSIQIADQLNLPTIVIVFDQAIYAKAQAIRWQTDLYLTRTVIRLGQFHTTMTFLACIGKRFGDAGLRDILIEAEICAQGSVDRALSGAHYNRSIRCHKLMYEALHRLRWQCFLETITEMELENVETIMSALKEKFPKQNHKEVVLSQQFSSLCHKYDSFIASKEECPTFRFWSSYLEMVEVLLLFVRATRQGDWLLHLSAVRSMCPWLFVTSRINYARYLPIYYLEMKSLHTSHPDIHQMFMNGDFVVQRQESYGFSQVACDMTIEQTCNKDTKTKGGVVGFSLNQGASQRWVLTHPERAAITRACSTYAGRNVQKQTRKDLNEPRLMREEAAICQIIECMEGFINPFTYDSKDLIHVVSGVVVPEAVAKDILSAYEKGEICFREFCQDRLMTNKKGFHDSIRTLKLLSFTDNGKTTKMTSKTNETTLRSQRNLMARLVIIGRERGIKIEDLMVYTLGPMPLSLAYQDGGLMKTNKANLLHYFEIKTPSPFVFILPSNSVWLVDAMAILQSISLRELPNTFGELAALYLAKVANHAKENTMEVVHLVADTYPAISIKNAERDRRARCQSACQLRETKIYSDSQKLPAQWKKYLSCGKNKEILMDFFLKSWTQNGRGHKFTLFVGHSDTCLKFGFSGTSSPPTVQEIEELKCSHEEADTRLLLHAKFARKSANSLVIQSPDTDVLVLCIAKFNDLDCSLWFQTGTGNKRRILNVGAIHSYVSGFHPSAPSALIGLHCFTGCDSVSSFHGKGKVRAVKLMLEESRFINFFSEVGRTFDISEGLMSKAEEFVCCLYGKNMKEVNNARASLFKTGKHMDDTLPPNKDSLGKHLSRANYQAAIHHRCLECNPSIPPPINHGWILDDGVLRVKWMDLLPAPEAVLELVNCKCKKSKCQTRSCTCFKNNLRCTEACSCTDCANRDAVVQEENSYGDEDDKEDLDESDVELDD